MLPRILHDDGEIGFRWARPDGTTAWLRDLLDLEGAEPDRWLPTHLEALDDALIETAGRLGEILGGGRNAAPDERDSLTGAYVALDRACVEYDDAHRAADLPDDVRAGQILGTAALMSIRLRFALGLVGPAPFDGELDPPPLGAVGGTCDLQWVQESRPETGARWIVTTTEGLRLPATLSMMLFDSSGVNKDAALDEHRSALTSVTEAAAGATDPMLTSGALDWLVFDWVMAHRESAESGAVEIRSGRIADARMLVRAVAASVRLRSRYDPELLFVA